VIASLIADPFLTPKTFEIHFPINPIHTTILFPTQFFTSGSEFGEAFGKNQMEFDEIKSRYVKL